MHVATSRRQKLGARTWHAVVIALAVLSGCKQAAVPIPPTPAPVAKVAKPTIVYFEAEPTTISGGQATLLRWSVENAKNLKIVPALGSVQATDRRQISPAKTTTYELSASNGAGSVTASVTVAVSSPPPPVAEARVSDAHLRIVNSQLKDIHFEYNGGGISAEEVPTLQKDATLMSDFLGLDPKANVTVEGYCDARGSDEYNMALGDRRASTVKSALVSLGVPEAKLFVVSYGKERPLCDDSTEECYARNRRVHFSLTREQALGSSTAR